MGRNYSNNTIKRLFALSGNKCSYPGCFEEIFTDDGILVGDIVHIEALKPGGPRYNNSQSDSQRNGFDNLMVMCKNHHAVIDNGKSFTVQLLKKWKIAHEKSCTPISIEDSFLNRIMTSLDEQVNVLVDAGFEHLENSYFSYHKVPDNSLDLWQNGFPFDLTSIKSGLQYTRPVVNQIIKKLDSVHNLLLLGEMGYGKTTLLMELICRYHDLGYVVLYNLTGSEVNNGKILSFVDTLIKEDKEVLLVLDNVHDERIVPIFSVIDSLSTHVYSSKVKVLMAARLPDFNFFMDERLHNVDESFRIPFLKFIQNTESMFQLIRFTKDEVGEFLKKYNIQRDVEEVYNITQGSPV